jgi:hypothetical protein
MPGRRAQAIIRQSARDRRTLEDAGFEFFRSEGVRFVWKPGQESER